MCGIFGIYHHPEASTMTYLGLHALQHRGQESAGIVSSDNKQIYSHKSMGLVQDVFSKSILSDLKGDISIGQVRYSTTGESHLKNAQPFLYNYHNGILAIAHNGNITNANDLRLELERNGSLFQSTSDTEILIHLIAKSRFSSLEDSIVESLLQIKGAYSLVLMTYDNLIAIRDPMGFRPLSLGILNESYIVSSESTAFDLIGAKYIRDIEPGEILIINNNGLKSIFPFENQPRRLCVFEYIYFARPDSQIDNQIIYEIRKSLGSELALEQHINADMVIPVPDSGVPGALGYSETSKIPFELGFIRSHYTGRTFIEPEQNIRHFNVKLKLNVIPSILKNKRVIIIDDSIVRGTTSQIIVQMVRDAGASEVHLRITSPPVKWPCFYGINTPDRRDLIASFLSLKDITDYIKADSIAYLSLEGTMRAVKNQNSFCDACFSGNYPVIIQDNKRRLNIIN